MLPSELLLDSEGLVQPKIGVSEVMSEVIDLNPGVLLSQQCVQQRT